MRVSGKMCWLPWLSHSCANSRVHRNSLARCLHCLPCPLPSPVPMACTKIALQTHHLAHGIT